MSTVPSFRDKSLAEWWRADRRELLSAALALAGVVFAWNTVIALAGLYTEPWLGAPAVLLIEFVGLALILRFTARGGRGFVRQAVMGLGVFVVLAAVLYVTTLLSLTFVTPDYGDVLAASYRDQLEATARFDNAEIERRVALYRGYFHPTRQSSLTFLATLLTGAVSAPLLAAFLRTRRPSTPSASSATPEHDS